MLSMFLVPLAAVNAFHDCVQPAKRRRRAPPGSAATIMVDEHDDAMAPATCSGGLCLGMHDGPHEGGPASYASAGVKRVHSTMSVPDYPEQQDGICYYIWTDVFFGDVGFGRMNQFVPQLILGNALSGSSGPPNYTPSWAVHDTWAFGAHYFFEIFNTSTNATDGHAAYGPLFPASPGETLYTTFTSTKHASPGGGACPASASLPVRIRSWISYVSCWISPTSFRGPEHGQRTK